MSDTRTRNSDVLESFVHYCQDHPELRFWQALRNWSGYGFVVVTDDVDGWDTSRCFDTFYWEGRDHEHNKTDQPTPSQ